MARGIAGTDSSRPVTTDLVQSATEFFGGTPAYWGRYFKSPTGGPAEYRHKLEDPVLSAAGIKVLPVSQQTKNVGDNEQSGIDHAKLNVTDFLLTFPREHLVSQGGQFLMFLDVEGDPPLSVDFYTGWAQTLTDFSNSESDGQVTLLPCIYAPQLNTTTWRALAKAAANGVECHGAWVARYPHGCKLQDFDPAFAIPSVDIPCDVLIWQYAENCVNGDLDLNQTNPSIDDIENSLLNKLVLPPSA